MVMVRATVRVKVRVRVRVRGWVRVRARVRARVSVPDRGFGSERSAANVEEDDHGDREQSELTVLTQRPPAAARRLRQVGSLMAVSRAVAVTAGSPVAVGGRLGVMRCLLVASG